MKFNGKEVYTPDSFDYSKAKIGDYVTNQVVDDAMNCLPPASMSYFSSQLGEPYSHKEDPDTGRWRPTYATFTKAAPGIWNYCGHCFRGENVERGKAPQYAI